MKNDKLHIERLKKLNELESLIFQSNAILSFISSQNIPISSLEIACEFEVNIFSLRKHLFSLAFQSLIFKVNDDEWIINQDVGF